MLRPKMGLPQAKLGIADPSARILALGLWFGYNTRDLF